MLANAAKHARASVVEVDAEASGGTLRVCVRDNGVGGADPVRSDLVHVVSGSRIR
jgi:signal transduction histidine kinase